MRDGLATIGSRRGWRLGAAFFIVGGALLLASLAVLSPVRRAAYVSDVAGELDQQTVAVSGLLDVLAEASAIPPAPAQRVLDRHDRLLADGRVFGVVDAGPSEDAMTRAAGVLDQAVQENDVFQARAAATAYRSSIASLRAALTAEAGRASDQAARRIRIGTALGLLLLAGTLAAVARQRQPVHGPPPDPEQLPLRTDPLTGVATRSVLTERLELAVAGAARTGNRIGVMFLDLDGFKALNDRYGHDTGDRVLVAVAERLRDAARRTDLVCRYGGDEFVVLLDHLDEPEGAATVAQKYLAEVRRPIPTGHVHDPPAVSIGIALYPDDTEEPAELVRLADAAMYAAKRAGGNTYRFSTAELREAESERHATAEAIRDALELGDLVLRYEAQHELGTGEVVGVEAQISWQRSDGTMVPANDFLDITEHTDLGTTIGTWMLDEALEQLNAWRQQGLTNLTMHVNLGGRYLRHGRPAVQLEDLLRVHELPARRVAVEVAEEVLVADPARTSQTLAEIAGLGVLLVLDDFGTGLSSLGRMAELPLDALKLDGSLVERLGTPDDEVVAGIVGLARELDLEVVASHVSKVTQLSRAEELGVRRAQGPLLSHPMSPDELVRAIQRQRSRR